MICSLTLLYLTQKSPIPNWIYYPQLEIGYLRSGIICQIGDILWYLSIQCSEQKRNTSVVDRSASRSVYSCIHCTVYTVYCIVYTVVSERLTSQSPAVAGTERRWWQWGMGRNLGVVRELEWGRWQGRNIEVVRVMEWGKWSEDTTCELELR